MPGTAFAFATIDAVRLVPRATHACPGQLPLWVHFKGLPHRNSNGRFTSINGHNVGEFYLRCRPPTLLARHARATLAPAKGGRIAPTCTCVHTPPRAVRTLRSLSFAAMALWLVAPARTISSIIGRTLAANRLALAFRSGLPRLAASAIPGLPSAAPVSWRPAARP